MDLAAMMQGMFGQIMGQGGAGGEKAQSGVMSVHFAMQKKGRAPASVAEERGLNIFDRVTYRYYFVGHRMMAGGR